MDPPIPLINYGAVCWFNSLIQAMMSFNNVINITKDIKEFNELFNYHTLNKQPTVRYIINRFIPDKIKYGQQSSSEGFVYLLENILEKEEGQDKNPIEALFTSRFRSSILCENCNKRIDVNMNHTYIPLFNIDDIRKSFVDAIRYHREKIEYNCEGCGKNSHITKLDQIRFCPLILVLSFNRYHHRELINYPIEFTIDNKIIYKLKAQIIHRGSLHGGHYYAEVKRGENYYICNDSSIVKIPNFNKYNYDAYMLFYERTN